MNWSRLVCRTHRWLSIAFTATVLANFVALGAGRHAPLLVYAPLAPLFLLMFSGLYMFALPYAARRRNRHDAGAQERTP
ncbi:MAG TPA: hypothetical protein VFL92_05080 [Sphingomonas sp.]|nr:hypothetical protein [Sphingomonas sp.]